MNNFLANKEVWFITGSQHLYGKEALKNVSSNAQTIAETLNESSLIPLKIVFKPILTTPGNISDLCMEANANSQCVGLITWMHTFSPAKMWINGLKQLQKPICHLHTQFNRDIPWNEIDMDFMNLNQSAHGGREYGFINSRLRLERKVIAGHWKDPKVVERVAVWIRAAVAWNEWQTGKVARFGDNMREVAVTEGDKVAAQLKFGFSVNSYGVGDLVEVVNDITDGEIQATLDEYAQTYDGVKTLLEDKDKTQKLKNSARIEIGMRKFLEAGDFFAFTTTFEDLHGLSQLPGLAVQRLMNEGYGFGAEGDWKTAALVRAMKVMDMGLPGGTSFMEDYTYHFDPDGAKVLGAHMLEVCPSVADGVPNLEIHPLGIGGKEDPARLVFNVKAGDAINATLMDMGNRFRMLVNEVKVVEPENLPKLPVARALWEPKPDLSSAAEMWILAGGAHHTGFSLSVTVEHMQDFAEMAGIECLIIDGQSSGHHFKNELRWNDLYYTMNSGLRQ